MDLAFIGNKTIDKLNKKYLMIDGVIVADVTIAIAGDEVIISRGVYREFFRNKFDTKNVFSLKIGDTKLDIINELEFLQ